MASKYSWWRSVFLVRPGYYLEVPRTELGLAVLAAYFGRGERLALRGHHKDPQFTPLTWQRAEAVVERRVLRVLVGLGDEYNHVCSPTDEPRNHLSEEFPGPGEVADVMDSWPGVAPTTFGLKSDFDDRGYMNPGLGELLLGERKDG